MGHVVLTDETRSQSRFLIRMGGIGWMVYDRERRGPAVIGTEVAARLTRDQAERLLHQLLIQWTINPERPT